MKWHVRFYYRDMPYESVASEEEWIVEAASEEEAISKCSRGGSAAGLSARPIDVEHVESLVQGEIKLRDDVRVANANAARLERELSALRAKADADSAIKARGPLAHELVTRDAATWAVRRVSDGELVHVGRIHDGEPVLDRHARELLLAPREGAKPDQFIASLQGMAEALKSEIDKRSAGYDHGQHAAYLDIGDVVRVAHSAGARSLAARVIPLVCRGCAEEAALRWARFSRHKQSECTAQVLFEVAK